MIWHLVTRMSEEDENSDNADTGAVGGAIVAARQRMQYEAIDATYM